MLARRKVLWLFLAASLSLCAGAEVLVRTVFLDAGMWQGWRPLPPFDALTNPEQARWLERQQAELAAGAEPERLVRFDAELGWEVRPNYAAPDRSFSSNAQGFRGPRDYATEVPPRTTRLICFGDSYTWCDEVGDHETWQSLLEREHAGLEALNLGTGGYGTDQALLRFRREGRHGADIVLIGLQLENLGRNVNRYRPRYYPTAASCAAKPRFVLDAGGELELVPLPFATRRELIDAIADGSITTRLGEHEYWGRYAPPAPLAWSALARVFASRSAYAERNVRRLVTDADGEACRTTLAILETFHREALASGARAAAVLVLMSGAQFRPLADDATAHYWAPLVAELERRGVPAIDVGPALAEAWGASRSEAFFAGAHLGPAGNAVVAREVARWVAGR